MSLIPIFQDQDKISAISISTVFNHCLVLKDQIILLVLVITINWQKWASHDIVLLTDRLYG